MNSKYVGYTSGIAFITEGETEIVFYQSYVQSICATMGLNVRECFVNDTPAQVVTNKYNQILLLFQDMGSVVQIPNAISWYINVCLSEEYRDIPWDVMLCYDTDAYNADISKFHEGDWRILRSSLIDARSITDLAAEADIEDIMLYDYEGVLDYLSLPRETKMPTAKKGKGKMKKLFREVAPYNAYHSGKRAKQLIDALDMNKIADSSGVPMRTIDKILSTGMTETEEF